MLLQQHLWEGIAMAYNKKRTTYDVNPVEVNGRLTGLEIRRWESIDRLSDNDKLLERGCTTLVEEMEIPISKVSDLVRELTDWPIWFATTPEEER